MHKLPRWPGGHCEGSTAEVDLEGREGRQEPGCLGGVVGGRAIGGHRALSLSKQQRKPDGKLTVTDAFRFRQITRNL